MHNLLSFFEIGMSFAFEFPPLDSTCAHLGRQNLTFSNYATSMHMNIVSMKIGHTYGT